MSRICLPALICAFTSICSAQLSDDQKIADLRQLSALYAKTYGPYEWKRDALGFDLLNLQPWLDRALRTQTDLEYLDLLSEYVSSLNDAHDVFTLPFSFSANLGFSVDIYDGKVLIDSITRGTLPLARYPFVVGDALVSVDGVSVEDWIARLSRYSIAANPRSTSRSAAGRITTRTQSRIPWAADIGDNAEVVIRRASGDLETYSIPWNKSGQAITRIGAVPSPAERAARTRAAVSSFVAMHDDLEPWQKPVAHLFNASIEVEPGIVLNSGGRSPIFNPPAGFVQRLGRSSSDVFYSGTFTTNGLRLGFIRIPSYSPSAGTGVALQQFDAEIAYFQDNTDGLIIDEMRNPGGSVLYVEQLCQRVINYPFRSIGFELRVLGADVSSFGSTLTAARTSGQPDWVVAGYEARFNDVLSAYEGLRGRTGPISLTQSSLDLQPLASAYTKPLIVLVDDFSASGGDAFPATIQDAARGLIVGYRTMGAGGNVVDYDATNYTEGLTRVTRSLMNRKNPIATADYPTAPYVENIGVRPDVELDYMTRENLMNGGRPFVEAFTRIMVDHIRKSTGL